VANKEKISAPKLGLGVSIRKGMPSEKVDVDGRLNARTGTTLSILTAPVAPQFRIQDTARPQTFRCPRRGCKSRSKSWSRTP
jgi:hypothetical protein